MRLRLMLAAAALVATAAACSDGGPAAPELRPGTPRAETTGNTDPDPSTPPTVTGNPGNTGNNDPTPQPTDTTGRKPGPPLYGSGG